MCGEIALEWGVCLESVPLVMLPSDVLGLSRVPTSRKTLSRRSLLPTSSVVVNQINLYIYKVFFFKTGFLCSFGTCPGTRSGDQVGLKLTEISLPLNPECWD